MHRAIMTLACAFAISACQGGRGPATDSGGGKADDPGCAGAALDDDGVCRLPDGKFAPAACCQSVVDQLADLLDDDGALLIPPPGQPGHPDSVDEADEVTFTVEVVDVPDGMVPHARAFAEQINEEEFFRDSSEMSTEQLCGAADQNDVAYEIRHGVEEPRAREELTDELVAPDLRQQVKDLMKGELDELFWLRIVDTGAEIKGADVVYVRPIDSDRALRITIVYFHG